MNFKIKIKIRNLFFWSIIAIWQMEKHEKYLPCKKLEYPEAKNSSRSWSRTGRCQQRDLRPRALPANRLRFCGRDFKPPDELAPRRENTKHYRNILSYNENYFRLPVFIQFIQANRRRFEVQKPKQVHVLQSAYAGDKDIVSRELLNMNTEKSIPVATLLLSTRKTRVIPVVVIVVEHVVYHFALMPNFQQRHLFERGVILDVRMLQVSQICRRLAPNPFVPVPCGARWTIGHTRVRGRGAPAVVLVSSSLAAKRISS